MGSQARELQSERHRSSGASDCCGQSGGIAAGRAGAAALHLLGRQAVISELTSSTPTSCRLGSPRVGVPAPPGASSGTQCGFDRLLTSGGAAICTSLQPLQGLGVASFSGRGGGSYLR